MQSFHVYVHKQKNVKTSFAPWADHVVKHWCTVHVYLHSPMVCKHSMDVLEPCSGVPLQSCATIQSEPNQDQCMIMPTRYIQYLSTIKLTDHLWYSHILLVT